MHALLGENKKALLRENSTKHGVSNGATFGCGAAQSYEDFSVEH